jgi:hypothetical protein
MRHYEVREVMTADPATVTPATPLKDVVHVKVTDGAVRLAGELERKSMLALIRPAVRAVDGVIDVEDDLGYAFDDTGPLPAPEHDGSPVTHSPIASRRLN